MKKLTFGGKLGSFEEVLRFLHVFAFSLDVLGFMIS